VPGLYPDVPVFHTEHLPVGDGHRLQVQHAGTPGGLPVLLLHGGPGSGQSPVIRRAFDPRLWHVIAPDQRGAGGSTPAGDTDHNTLPQLLADLRALRAHLGLSHWLVVGGSWGATLALAHAVDEPQAIAGLLLRASFLARPADIAAFFDPSGRPASAPWAGLAAAAGVSEPAAFAPALQQLFAHGSPAQQQAAALAWAAWEQALAGQPSASPTPTGSALAALAALVQRYRVQSHWLAQGCGMDPPLLQRAARAPAVPTLLLHADDDGICAPQGARALLAALQARHADVQLRWATGAGHNPAHPAMAALQRLALDHWAEHGRWPVPSAWGAA